MILTHFQAKEILDAVKNNQKEIEVSLDLGISRSMILIEKDLLIFPDGQKIEISKLKKVIKDNTVCFMVRDSSVVKIQLFSEETNRFYKLVPTRDAPTIEISGIRMHATKDMAPMEDTKRKLETVLPFIGSVLDTCMGLGYTAIAASKHADLVFTCEKDENVLELAKLNPWSKELFNNKKISIIKTNAFDQIKIFKSSMFDIVIHDPPRFSMATDLYSPEFYRQVYRVMKKNGKLYHYTGSPGGKKGIDLALGSVKRLSSIGFKDVKKVHYGVSAVKL